VEPIKFSGHVNKWKLNGAERNYIVVTLPFKTAREVLKPNLYTADTGDGEQRQIFPSHVRSIRKDMADDKFTPMPVAAGLNDKLANALTQSVDGSIANLTIDDSTGSLPLIDGGHRFNALEKLVEQGVEDALNVPITTIIFLDNRNKENFLNAQKGRTVDKAHMLSLQVGAELTNSKIGPFLRTALEIAKILNEDEKSPFHRFVQFDSRKGIGLLPISTLSAKGGSDLGTSLVGTAKIVQAAGKDAQWGAQAIIDAFQAINSKAKHLLEVGRPLTPPPGGSRGSATMWIGLGNLLAYRKSLPNPVPDEEITESLVEAIKKICDHPIRGNFSGPKKRELLGEIAYSFFGEVNNVPFYNDEIPQGLVDILSYSTFSLKKPKKVKKPKAEKKPAPSTGTGKKRGRPKKVKEDTPAVELPPPVAPAPKVIEETPAGVVIPDNFESGPAPWEQDSVEEEVQA
jgi:hypothetical protein